MDREASPTAVLDSQSIKSAEGGGHDRGVGYDAGIQDRDGAALVIDKIRHRFPWLELIWADAIYNAHQVDAAVAKVPCLRIEIVKRRRYMKGFVVLPHRWVVERIFSWFGRNRRLAKDFENLANTLVAFVTIASIQLAVRRLARPRRRPTGSRGTDKLRAP